MNIFTDKNVARDYDAYYTSEQGKTVDDIEKQAIIEFMKPVMPGRMLEVGCGTGHWTELFSRMGFRVTATDVSQAMMAYTKNKSLPGVTFSEADVLNLPFPDNHFDQVATVTALEFCGDIQQAFSEMRRVLKSGGWLIAGCLNADSMLGKTKNSDPVFRHAKMMTRSELKNHLETIGIPVIHECVFFSPEFELLDHTGRENTVAGAFMAAAVQKK